MKGIELINVGKDLKPNLKMKHFNYIIVNDVHWSTHQSFANAEVMERLREAYQYVWTKYKDQIRRLEVRYTKIGAKSTSKRNKKESAF